MFISEKYKFIFLEVPRTASISITEALSRMDPESPTVKRRQKKGSLDGYHSFDMPADLAKYPIIVATHRNPYDRLWSFWKHRHRSGNPEIFKSVSWPRYVKWACDPSTMPEITNVLLDVPISEMLGCEIVSYWLRFESLRTSWKQLSIERSLPLPELSWLNASVRLGHFHDAYDAHLASMVSKRFAADFDRFHYEVDSWKFPSE
jgi:Sulfotransferase family